MIFNILKNTNQTITELIFKINKKYSKNNKLSFAIYYSSIYLICILIIFNTFIKNAFIYKFFSF